MTLYKTLCCYQSPYWPNYQDILDMRYDYAHEKVEYTLPRNAVDSYLGRLISLAKAINEYMDNLKAGDLEEYIQVVNIFSQSGAIVGRKLNSKVKGQVEEFLSYGLDSSWIGPLLNEYKLGLWTSKKASLNLNEPAYLEILCKLKDSPYSPVVAWFAEHPNAHCAETQYVEADKSE